MKEIVYDPLFQVWLSESVIVAVTTEVCACVVSENTRNTNSAIVSFFIENLVSSRYGVPPVVPTVASTR